MACLEEHEVSGILEGDSNYIYHMQIQNSRNSIVILDEDATEFLDVPSGTTCPCIKSSRILTVR